MNILLLAPTHQELYKPIIAEMERIGHHVGFIEDIVLPYSPFYMRGNRLKTIMKRIYFSLARVPQRYWKRKIAESLLLNQFYDVLFCINGASFHPMLLTHLQKFNPQIRTSLYIWDTCQYYNFMYKKKLFFDKIYSFDYSDSVRHNIHYLPFYWIPTNKDTNQVIKYAISIVGTDHDERYHIVKKIAAQLRKVNLPFCFKIVINSKKYSEYQDKEIVTKNSLSPQETMSIMQASECILDTDRESQFGTTPRMIWAMAMEKKIVTTNTNVKELPFYDPKQFCIINRQNPVIDVDFIRREQDGKYNNAEYIKTLCITQWVHNFM